MRQHVHVLPELGADPPRLLAATYSLDKYEDLQTHIESAYPGSHLYNNDIIDAQIVSIVFCVLVSCSFPLAETSSRLLAPLDRANL